MVLVREPVDLVKKVRDKFIRNREFINKAIELCDSSNNSKRTTEPENSLILLYQYRKINYELIDEYSTSTWKIFPYRKSARYFAQHQVNYYNIPRNFHCLSVVFSAEKAKFGGASLRVRFFKVFLDLVFTQTINIPAEMRNNCWEFVPPKGVFCFNISFRLHQENDR